jgi:maleylpyruvate isomerase
MGMYVSGSPSTSPVRDPSPLYQASPVIGLHEFYRSSTSYRVRIALNLKGIQYKSIPVSLSKAEHRSAAFRELNPQGLVPVLETKEGVLTQSAAILEYVEELYPDPPLLPLARLGRARVRALAAIVGCDIHPLNNLRILTYLRQELGQDEQGLSKWITRWIDAGFEALNALLELDSTRQGFCFGSSPTLADVYLMPQIYSARRFNIDLTRFAFILDVERTCAQMEAFERAHPDHPSVRA